MTRRREAQRRQPEAPRMKAGASQSPTARLSRKQTEAKRLTATGWRRFLAVGTAGLIRLPGKGRGLTPDAAAQSG